MAADEEQSPLALTDLTQVLPQDAQVLILSLLSWRELPRAACVCKARPASSSDALGLLACNICRPLTPRAGL